MYTIRPFNPTPSEYETIVAIHNAATPNQKMTVEIVKYYDETTDPDYLFQREVIERAGEIIAYGFYGQFKWAYHPDKYYWESLVPLGHPDDAAIRGALSGTSLPDLGSEAVAIGANVTQVGLAFAKKFDIGPNGLSLGFTPKVQRIEVLNIAVGLDDDADDISDDFSDSKYRSDDTAVNFDLGAAFHASENWTFGLAVRDVMGSDLASKTTSGRTFTYDLSPVVTAGAAYNGETITVAADVDLTQHERFGRGDESQFLRVGAEAGWEWAQFRVGYQMDIEDGTNDIATAGIGFSPFGVLHMDLAAAAGDDTYGAVLSISFTF